AGNVEVLLMVAQLLAAVELVDEVLKPHFSSRKVRRDLSFVNISEIPIPNGIVWDKVTFDIYGPT
ncbi:hypothetical protein NDU88_002471, partial [Pleurodeles waltl]